MKGKRTILIVAAISLVLGILVGQNSSLTGWPISFDLQTDNYVGTFTFQLDVPNAVDINQEIINVTGVKTKTRTGSNNFGQLIHSPVTVERIYKGIDDLYNWRLEVESGTINPQDITITTLDSAFSPMRKIVLIGAFPSQWQLPDMNASSLDPAIETFTLYASQVYETNPN